MAYKYIWIFPKSVSELEHTFVRTRISFTRRYLRTYYGNILMNKAMYSVTIHVVKKINVYNLSFTISIRLSENKSVLVTQTFI